MKKYNYILIMVMAFAMTLASCSQKEDVGVDDVTRTAEFEVSFSKAELMKSGSLVSPNDQKTVDEIIYCDDRFATNGIVELTYELSFDGGVTSVEYTEKFEYDTESTVAKDGISKLIQFDFPPNSDPEAFATIKVTQAVISGYNDKLDDSQTELLEGEVFVAPVEGSPFADYVDNPVGKEWIVKLYEKTYVKVEVLCFNKQAIALFGYTWFDFEILTGEEVCVFFNCLGTTSDTYHQVFAVDIEAFILNESGEADALPYWSGANYAGSADRPETDPICIPMPGKYADYGAKLVISPVNSGLDDIEITITPDQIQAFLDKTITPEGATLALAEGDSGYKVVVAEANGVPFLHYTMDHCDTNKAYLVNTLSGATSYYKIDYLYDAGAPEGSKFTQFSVDQLSVSPAEGVNYNAMQHLALSRDQSTLYAIQQQSPGGLVDRQLFVIDTYTGKLTALLPDAASAAEKKAMFERMDMPNDYLFSELVFVDGKLYAGCDQANCLVEIIILADHYEYGDDLIKYEVNSDIMGGDLLASNDGSTGKMLYSFSKRSSLIAGSSPSIIPIHVENSSIQNRIPIEGLANITGVCVLVDDSDLPIGVLTLHNNDEMKAWSGSATPQKFSVDFDISSSDLASWNNSWKFSQTTLLGFLGE